MNTTTNDVIDFFTPLPNRYASLDAAVGELFQPKNTSSFIVTCGIISLYALGIFAVIRHRINARIAGENYAKTHGL